MLREYRLTNFKAFGETVTIPIRPLTLIFGANSSGKSSIFQSLLLLKQTLEEAKNPNTALLPKGSLVDLGTYSDFVHRQDIDRDFEFRVRFDLESRSNTGTADASSKREKGLLSQREQAIAILNDAGAMNAGLTFRFSYDEEKHAAVSPPRVDLTIGDERQPLISDIGRKFTTNFESEFWRQWWNNIKDRFDGLLNLAYDAELGEEKCEIPELRGILQNSQLEDVINDLREMNRSLFYVKYKNFIPDSVNLFNRLPKRKQSIFNAQLCIMTNYPTEDGNTADYGEIDFLNFQKESNRSIREVVTHLCFPLPQFLESLVYLGPLRSQPEHYYEYSGDLSEYVGQRGENLPSILLENPDVLKKTNEDLKRLGVRYRLKTSRLLHEDGSPSYIFSLHLTDTNTYITASLRDVGFGISQVLPIVLQSCISEKKTLIIEQPEIHLHPAHQAELGDMFIRSAKERGNTLLLETHSEHLLLRIMRRMRETSTGKLPEGAIEVRPEDVMVLFVESDGSQSIVREMPLDERGELVKAWPGGFFEEGLREIL